jgi:hypothetical protein
VAGVPVGAREQTRAVAASARWACVRLTPRRWPLPASTRNRSPVPQAGSAPGKDVDHEEGMSDEQPIVTDITGPDDHSSLLAALSAMAASAPPLPGDADDSPVLPGIGVPGPGSLP